MSIRNFPPRTTYETYREFIDAQLPRLNDMVASDEDYDTKPDHGKDAEERYDQTYARFGAFALKRAQSPIDILDDDGKAVLAKDESYASIHLLPLSKEQATLPYVRQSLDAVATALETHEYGDIEKVAGITYARMGRTAVRFGFSEAGLPIQIDPAAHPDARPVVVYADKADLIARHGRTQAAYATA